MPFLKPRDTLLHYRYRPGDAARMGIVFSNSLGTDLSIWDAVVDALPRDIPILAYDKRGHGLSGDGPITPDTLADDVADLMAHFGMGPSLICGVSVGGLIAQMVAHRHPRRVTGLMLCMTSHVMGTPDAWDARIAAIEAGGLDSIADAVMERWFSPTFRETQAVETEGYRTMLARSPEQGYIDTCRMIRDADLTDIAKGHACPVHCLSGGADLAAPPDSVRALADLIPNAGYTCLDGVGHLPSLEAPDRLTALLLDFHAELS